MLSGNKRFQRITVGVIIGVVVISLALSLVSAGWAATLGEATGPGQVRAAGDGSLPLVGATPTRGGPAFVGTSKDPLPVTKTPQGTSTQVTDKEHLGGLVAFLVLMLGGALLLVRAKRRERLERVTARGPESILSRS